MATIRNPDMSRDPDATRLEDAGSGPLRPGPDLSAGEIGRLAGALLESIERGEIAATVAEIRFLRSVVGSSAADSTA